MARVLLVEDDAVDSRLAKQLLTRSSRPIALAVDLAESLSAAIECLRANNYDIILLDLMLPDSSGLETVARVHAANPQIPIVVLTGLDDKEIGPSAIRNGATDFLVKGHRLKTSLVQTVLYALGRKEEKKLLGETSQRLQETSQQLLMAKRDIAEKVEALQRSQATLQLRVEERTAELTRANELLKEEITHREQAERGLRSSEENLRTAVAISPSGIAIVDRTGVIQFVNPAAERLFGRTAAELLGELFGLPLMQGEATEIETVHPGGRRGIAEMRVTGTEWNGQNAYLISLHDITDRKRAEVKTIEAARRWRTTFDSITDLLSIHDKDFKIVRVNRALAIALKAEPRELIGRICYEVFHGLKQPCPDCPHVRTLASKEPATLERFEPRLGMYLDISTSPVFDETGEIYRSVHIVKNITERKQAEETLEEANRRLTEYNQLKDAFIATASHELRTPVSIVVGAIRLLLDGMPANTVEEQRSLLSVSMQNMERLGRIVDSLLNLSRIESGTLVLHPVVVNICGLVQEVASGHELLARQKGIRLDCDVPHECIDIRLDPDRMTEVLENLLSNSLRFTPTGGWIRMLCRRHNGVLQISVQDSGIGIARDDLPKVFEKFSQFGRTAGPGYHGTGLGLAIVKNLVDLQGGDIAVESEVGRGTTFTVSLPLTTKPDAESPPADTDALMETTLANT